MLKNKQYWLLPLTWLCCMGSLAVQASGIVPETSLVIIEEAEQEGVITVKNTDTEPLLLHVVLENLPEDQDELLFVTPPVIRVEAGQQQLVRFLLNSPQPLSTERLRRVIFEGIPTIKSKSSDTIQMTYQQNLPVLIRPKGLTRNRQPWTLLQWKTVDNNALRISNDSPYVVRFASQLITLLPTQIQATLPKAYILPGEQITVRVKEGQTTLGANQVNVVPATSYGYQVDNYITNLAIN